MTIQRFSFAAPLAAATTLALLLSAAHAADIEDAAAERLSDHEVKITWSDNGDPVDVYMGTDPAAGPDAMSLVSDDDTDGSYVVRADIMPRPYFLLVPQKGESVHVAERVLPLEGGSNFRDLGGYETESGKEVKWGLLFRSAQMSDLTMHDYGYLRALHINVICDFRATEERQNQPTEWQKFGVKDYLARDYELDFMNRLPDTKGEKLNAKQATDMMAGFYKTMPMEFASNYRQMFQELLAGDAPLAFNCSAGKDRTGVAAALILTALGVPREQVVSDYQLSNRYYKPNGDRQAASETEKQLMSMFDEEALRALMGTQPRFIEAAFKGMEEEYGSVDGYFETALGVGDAERAKLRSMFLQ